MTHLAGGFEPCPSYRAPIEHDEPVCAGCGHLADDHAGPGARVLALADRRGLRRVERPARRAS
ncbi:MAG TPA: hypothetical protein VH914_10295 [Acidimicrobiia bacterium]|jgi:hypothetical protein|nr:hypothetical protein [Acidimicrobiia bacterium]